MLEKKTKQRQCVHYWIIDTPDGQTSFGRCKYCGMVKEFSNNLEAVFTDKNLPSNDHNAPSDI